MHNTTQNSSDNLPSYLQTNIIAQMLSRPDENAVLFIVARAVNWWTKNWSSWFLYNFWFV